MSDCETLLLPGLGSPESARYQDVYHLLAEEAQRRELPMRCLKYRGQGHLAEGRLSGEITLPGIARAIISDVEQSPPGSLLLCRSFGCFLPGYLASYHGLNLARFRRIVLWGPVPYFHMWRLFGTRSKIAKMNIEAKTKGVRLSPSFFESMVPLEICCEALVDTEVVIALGTEDRYADPSFPPFLAGVLRKHGNRHVRVEIVEGAPHEVTSAEKEEVKRAYLKALFE